MPERITREDLDNLIAAHNRLRDAINADEPEHAARICCDELKKLAERRLFEAAYIDVTSRGGTPDPDLSAFARQLGTFLIKEKEGMRSLGLQESQCEPILGRFGAALEQDFASTEWSAQAVTKLESDLAQATALVCNHAPTLSETAIDWAVSHHGATLLSAAVVVAADTLTSWADQPLWSYCSVKAGWWVARKEARGLYLLLWG